MAREGEGGGGVVGVQSNSGPFFLEAELFLLKNVKSHGKFKLDIQRS